MESDSYFSLFMNSAFGAGNETAVFTLLFLFLARMLPIIAMSPFFGARVLPNPAKVAFAISLFAVFLPQMLRVITKPIPFGGDLLIFLAKEGFVGIAIGYIMSIPFIIVQTAGMIIDHQRGGASLMVNDPTIQNQSSPLGTLFNMVLIVVFFMLDGPFYFLDAIMKSYEIVPPDGFLSAQFFSKQATYWQIQLKLFNQIMVVAIQIAAPALIAILMTDMFLGIANRLAPQVQITFLGMPLKSLLGLFAIWLGWFLMTKEYGNQVNYWLETVTQVIGSMKD